MSGVVSGFLERCGRSAQSAGRYFTGIDVATAALRRIAVSQSDDRITHALNTLEGLDLSAVKLSERDQARAAAGGPVKMLFDLDAAKRDCESVLAARRMRGRVVTGVLMWIAESEVNDKVSGFFTARQVLARCGLTFDRLADLEVHRRAAVPLGTPIDAEGQVLDENDVNGCRFLGRWDQLASHRKELRRALMTGEHYFLVGARGIGKSTFVKRLLEGTLRAFADDPPLAHTRFLWCEKQDLISSAENTRMNFAKLGEAVDAGLTPVIDNLEVILQEGTTVAEEANVALERHFLAARRSLVLIAERGRTNKLPFLDRIPSRLLPAPSHAVAEQIAADYLRATVDREADLVLDGTPEELGRRACRLAGENYADLAVPQSVLKLINGAIAQVRPDSEGDAEPRRFGAEALLAFVASNLNIPRAMMEREGTALLGALRDDLLGNVVAQDRAVTAVATRVALGERLSTGQKPRACFLFAGPPGVGKTHLARSLADALGYDQQAFAIFNMSEYATESGRTRFIGADPGYKGYGTTRTIYDVVGARPSCVILLDEIDRAHPSLQDVLLPILDGHGADATGRTFHFSRTIIIATTNLGMEQIEAAWRQGAAEGKSRDEIGRSLDDDTLRDLMLRGAIDKTERAMQQALDRRIVEAREAFEAAANKEERSALISTYLALTRQREAFQLTRRHATLDRAFLDRIDVVVPFLPITTRDAVERILDLKLRQLGWAECPAGTRAGIVGEVVANGSVRMIERLVKSRLMAAILADDRSPMQTVEAKD